MLGEKTENLPVLMENICYFFSFFSNNIQNICEQQNIFTLKNDCVHVSNSIE